MLPIQSYEVHVCHFHIIFFACHINVKVKLKRLAHESREENRKKEKEKIELRMDQQYNSLLS